MPDSEGREIIRGVLVCSGKKIQEGKDSNQIGSKDPRGEPTVKYR